MKKWLFYLNIVSLNSAEGGGRQNTGKLILIIIIITIIMIIMIIVTLLVCYFQMATVLLWIIFNRL